MKTISINGAGALTIIRKKISDAEQAGVREVPLSNLRRLINQIEQDVSDDRVNPPMQLKVAIVGLNATQAA